MSQSFEIMEGTRGIGEADVAHLMVPGRYRSPDGMGLHPFSEQRAATAAEFYIGHLLGERSGLIVCSGYKNPGDQIGEPWRDDNGIEYQGIPEAYGMRHSLIDKYGIPAQNIRTEVKSVDTVTNFTNSQRLFPDDRPVGIVAQEQHLHRILKIVAPRTMERDYVGIVVPELPGHIDKDAFSSMITSHLITLGLTSENPDNAQKAAARAQLAWKIALGIRSALHFGPLDKVLTMHSKPS